MTETSSRGEDYEQEHVHDVYDQIATHFSSTRYKPWPIVERFLLNIPDGAVGIDVGCGNGKYLSVNPNVYIIASDRSPKLAEIASQRQKRNASAKSNPNIAASNEHAVTDVAIANGLNLPHPANRFDFAISIAVIHHFSTKDRRIRAIQEILQLLKPQAREKDRNYEGKNHASVECDGDGENSGKATDGIALFYVWALEQKESRRGWDEEHEQDVMVPWVMKKKMERKNSNKGHKREGPKDESNILKPGEDKNREMRPNTSDTPNAEITFHRYYHLYRNGELEADIAAARGQVVCSGYEKDNWWALAKSSPTA